MQGKTDHLSKITTALSGSGAARSPFIAGAARPACTNRTPQPIENPNGGLGLNWSHGARLALDLPPNGPFSPKPLYDLQGQHVPDGFEDAERAVLVRALGVSRATLHRKLGPQS